MGLREGEGRVGPMGGVECLRLLTLALTTRVSIDR